MQVCPWTASNPAADLALPQGNTYQYDTFVIPKGTAILEGSRA